jgi:hypothetical protein
MAKAKVPRNGNGQSKKVTAISGPSAVSAVKKNGAEMDLEAEIRLRAYQLYEQRGYTPGRENEDWLVAEREILARSDHHQSA